MDTSVTFPAQLDDFLTWVKTTTELAWTNAAPDDVMYQAKWLPLTELEIEALEKKHHIKFDYEHRLFLKILHTIDKDYNYVAPEDADIPTREHVPAFYNWLKDSDEIDRMIDWPYDTISDSVPGTRGAWLKSWGTQPATDAEKLAVCTSWYKKAPQLLPVFDHSFLMADAGTGLKPLLSVYGLDTIVVAWSLRHFLMRTFAEELDLEDRYFDEEDLCYYTRMKRGIPELDEWEYIRLSQANIPVWKEVITYYTSANPWEGFFF